MIPDYADHPKGMRISGVRQGGPADQAGIKDGDVLIKMGDTEIKNIYDYTYALGKYKHGDKVKVVVLRGENADQMVTLEVTLRGRKK
ncbi:MAG: PDZ domain-containing protein [Methanobacteriota archaeon]|nr:MAG: PDZ domain-containing protein [Euryarchaeota archaeon]